MSESLAPFEWLSRYLGYHPQAKLQSSDPERVPVVDDMVQPLRDRWIYVICDRLEPRVSFVGIEIFVDEDGNCFYSEINRGVTPLSPISKRSPKLRTAGASGPTIALPMTDAGGHALEIRLLFSHYRLPSVVTKKIGKSGKLQKAIRRNIAPLWLWEEGENELATLISSDGFSLVETPLYFSPTADPDTDDAAPRGESMRVWVGTDPFTVVKNCSDLYVDAREDYLREFQPSSESGQRIIARTALAQTIHDAILAPDDARARYGKYVRGTEVSKELERIDKRRKRHVRAYEVRAAALCKVLDDELFQLCVTASLDPELIEGDDRSLPVSDAVEALGVAARRLDESRFGRALYIEWVSKAETDPRHLLNEFVLSNTAQHISAFKAFRWGSKALANIVKTALEHRVALRRVTTRLQVAELLEPAVRMSMPNHASVHVVDVDFVAGMVGEVEIVLQRTKLSRKTKVSVLLPTEDVFQLVQDWTAADELTKTKAAKRFLGIRSVGAMMLDGVNAIIAASKIAEAEGDDATAAAQWSGLAAGVGAARTVVEQALNWDWAKARFGINEAEQLAAKRILTGVGALVTAYYGWSNSKGAYGAFKKGDNDRGFALSVAAAAEFAALASELYWIYAPASLVAPWVVVGAAAIAAGAYIAADVTKNDPLAEFLERCDWGTAPYSPLETALPYDDRPAHLWKSDMNHQTVLLVRLLVRMRAWWTFESWPTVTVAWDIQNPTAELEVEWVHTYNDGKTGTPLRTTLAGDGLNWKAPHRLELKPERAYNTMSGLDEVILTLRYRPNIDAPQTVLKCVLMESGAGKTSGLVGHHD